MKKGFLFVISALCLTAGIRAQDKYTQTMEKNITMLDTARTPDAFVMLGNNFQRIADVEKNQWLPYYYAAYCQIMNGFMQMGKDASLADGFADRAEEQLVKAEALVKDNSEISCLRKLTSTLRVVVDPQTRWEKYGTEATKYLQKAREQDPSNPRPDLLEAQDLYYTPEAVGGDKKKAAEMFVLAIKKFDTFKPATSLHPRWGKAQAEYLLSQTK